MSRGHWIGRGVATVAISGLAFAGTAGTALAHECYNDSRSARGDSQAAESAAWTPLSTTFLSFVISEVFGFEPLTDEQLADALAIVAAEKAGGEFDAVYALDRSVNIKSLAMGGKGAFGSDKSSDNRAIEHAEFNIPELEPLIEHLIGVYFAAGGTGPAA